MEINERLELVCKEKYPSLKAFADAMGVSAPYVCNLLNGKFGCGTKPVMWVIEHHPDIDARWLITGEGTIYGKEENYVHHVIQKLMELEKYICVMSTDDIHHFVNCMNGFDIHFPMAVIKRLEKSYNEKYKERDTIINDAMKKNLEVIHNNKIEK